MPRVFLSAMIACSVAAPLATSALALDPDDPAFSNAVFIRIIDTGPGLAIVGRAPGDGYFIYDAGHWNQTRRVMAAVRAIVPVDEAIDVMILSHSDADHLGAVENIFEEYQIDQVARSGYERDTATWKKADKAIRDAADRGETEDFNLDLFIIEFGDVFRVGDADLEFVAGWHAPPGEWDIKNRSEERNAGSIIAKLHFGGRTILLTGDAVGRHLGADESQLIATEQFLFDNNTSHELRSDILIAAHHGSDGASASRFIRKVDPSFVVFSAGHNHEHPTKGAAERFLDMSIPKKSIYRTDLGDDEGGDEWKLGRRRGSTDQIGDDNVDIVIHRDGSVVIAYDSAKQQRNTLPAINPDVASRSVADCPGGCELR